ncbi:hypothetical protein [Streptomyces lonarensis]|uniref:Uncharacterized protein n=1 Tax=Streptomyces lonarensis TaxID=700599 RepID=A0A7X6CXE2_9ACTN|nr:hypothetical protein [Streptomyces lonarensis]NJQ04235.1 hypothetical protein [Streptomyces lonarensis]
MTEPTEQTTEPTPAVNDCPGCGLIDPAGVHDGTCEIAAEEAAALQLVLAGQRELRIAGLIVEVQQLRERVATLTELTRRWDEMASATLGSTGDDWSPVAAGRRARAWTYQRAAEDVRDVLRVGHLPHGLMTDAELDAATEGVAELEARPPRARRSRIELSERDAETVAFARTTWAETDAEQGDFPVRLGRMLAATKMLLDVVDGPEGGAR